MIEEDPALRVIAEAGEGKTALALIEQHQPDVAVLDIDMPEGGGFFVARALSSKRLGTEIVFLTMHSEREILQEAMALDVKGYVLKDSAMDDIVSGIRSVAAGRPFVSPALAGHLLERRRAVAKLEEDQAGLAALTPAERRILKMIAADQSSKEIAAELFISPRTVETHRTNICAKLGLQGPLALVRYALTHKLEL